MFDIITKEDYWGWLAENIDARARQPTWQKKLLGVGKRLRSLLRPARLYELKDVQDAFILSRLGDQRDVRILEVGGGMPRILQKLSQDNETWLIDRYEGVGRGPKRAPEIPRVKVVQGFMGEFSRQLPDNYFDFLFSVSVVEHVPLDALESFFADCARVLKPAGRMFHAIDIYLFDQIRDDLNQPFQERLGAYLGFADRLDLGIRLVESAQIDKTLSFSCAYASQPDNALHQWYLHSPQEKRLYGQVVSIKSAWEK